MAKKRVKRAVSTASSSKVHLAFKYMLLFAVAFGFSLGIYYASENLFWMNLFWGISLVTGVLALTFLIAYLTLFFMKWFRK